jgi:uncharacterized SAM-binding protein YcdF (DUF218 family)
MNINLKFRLNGPTFRIAAFAILACIICSSCSYSKFAVREAQKGMTNAPYDVIIVPGVPYQDSAMSRVLTARIIWAKHLYDLGAAKNIIFSGSAVYTPYYEGEIMKVYGDSLGIPSNHTFAETRAEHSTENVWYSMKMARKMGFNKIALATDPFQTKMIGAFLRRHCKGIALLPIDFKQLALIARPLPVICADKCKKTEGFVALPQRESFWKRLRGTFGHHINFKEHDGNAYAECPH